MVLRAGNLTRLLLEDRGPPPGLVEEVDDDDVKLLLRRVDPQWLCGPTSCQATI